jgi:hypothetical protein
MATELEWYPADALKIVEWQVVKGTIDSQFTQQMLDFAKRNPDVSQQSILNNALPALQITAAGNAEFYAVSWTQNILNYLLTRYSTSHSRSTKAFFEYKRGSCCNQD